MSFKTLCALINSDILRYRATGSTSTFKIIFLYQAFWASFTYRVFDFLYIKTQSCHALRLLVSIFYHISNKIIQITTGISIPAGTRIGEGLYLAHYGPIMISGASKLGDNCNIGNQVIIGFGKSKSKPGHPELGNRVFVGPGAKIFGPVKIGNDVAIGANAVVTGDVPDRALVGGIPAKIINYHGSFAYIRYFGQEHDQERIESLKIARQLDPAFNPDGESFIPEENE
jgi:serine O-acetyltransferase